jgi:hypothetical protein
MDALYKIMKCRGNTIWIDDTLIIGALTTVVAASGLTSFDLEKYGHRTSSGENMIKIGPFTRSKRPEKF